jgi:hypothetical protein
MDGYCAIAADGAPAKAIDRTKVRFSHIMVVAPLEEVRHSLSLPGRSFATHRPARGA